MFNAENVSFAIVSTLSLTKMSQPECRIKQIEFLKGAAILQMKRDFIQFRVLFLASIFFLARFIKKKKTQRTDKGKHLLILYWETG